MKVLVYGAGQLAQMMYLAAAPLGVDVKAVDVSNREILHPVSKQKLELNLDYALADVDVVTAEFEHVPEELLSIAEESGKLSPNARSILTGADRVREKALLDSCGIPNAEYRIIRRFTELEDVIQSLGERVILKASRDGYDGYGQWRYQSPDDMEGIKTALASLDLDTVPIVAEKMVNFDREISLVGARTKDGKTACFDIAENLHHKGQLHVSIAPATHLSDALKAKAQEIFTAITNALDYVGVLAVELFQVGDSLLVNEIAPRVHNSGHWTQNGAETCQFEQHIRACLNFPLGAMHTNKVTAMINIIGCTSFSRDLISIPGCHLHWYGKEVREKRKMGHINVTAESYHELSNKLEQLMTYLPEPYFPKISGEIGRLRSI
ncbi:5-(carboxyamino)imidazole ribonucleotide synthase [Agaribacter flavus]|uniref:N5-carboxyaminoimidazole ribonucleotide synthase n=1 Tax=Agaribacter flavus TaxID=1902781 RepID=A0ABV7FR64_9ALTE